jgi:peptidyl-prolyl cis-trans isomerase D
MLRFLSRQERSSKVLLIALLVLLCIGLVAFFTGSIGGRGGAADDDSTAARVANQKVTIKDLKDGLRNMASRGAAGQGGGEIDDPAVLYQTYGRPVLDGLISQKLVEYEADQLGLAATDAELLDHLKQQFPGGSVQYKQFIQSNQLTDARYEDILRFQISQEKLQSLVTAAVQVSAQEVEDDYRRSNTKYNARWVDVRPDQLKDKVQVNDGELHAFFDQHKSDFRINSDQRKARYIFVDQTRAGEAIQVPDDELKKNFDPERAVRQVRVSEIVLHIPKEKSGANKNAAGKAGAAGNDNKNASATAPKESTQDEKTQKKADDIVTKAQTGDFAALARQYSEDAKSKAAGGDLGWINKKDKRDTDDPLNRVFTMKKDEVSQPIRKGDNFYILKVTERKVPAFEESREQLLKEARASKGYTKAVEIATGAEQKFKESKNADAVAAEINKNSGVDVASVKETPFFAEGDNLPNLGSAPDFESAVFQLASPNDVGDRQNVTGGFAIPQYIEKRDPHDPPFEDVKTKVEEQYRTEKSKELAADRAKQLAKAQSPDQLKSMVESMGLKTDERADASGNDSIGPLVSEGNKAPIYKLSPGQVTAEPIKVENGDDYVVVGLISRKDADMGPAFEKEKKGIQDRLLGAKRDMMFSTFLSNTEKRLKDEGKIKIYQDVIDQAMQTMEASPQRPGGGPAGIPGRGRPPRRTGPARR